MQRWRCGLVSSDIRSISEMRPVSVVLEGDVHLDADASLFPHSLALSLLPFGEDASEPFFVGDRVHDGRGRRRHVLGRGLRGVRRLWLGTTELEGPDHVDSVRVGHELDGPLHVLLRGRRGRRREDIIGRGTNARRRYRVGWPLVVVTRCLEEAGVRPRRWHGYIRGGDFRAVRTRKRVRHA